MKAHLVSSPRLLQRKSLVSSLRRKKDNGFKSEKSRLKSNAFASSSSSSSLEKKNNDGEIADKPKQTQQQREHQMLSPQTRERLKILLSVDNQGLDTMLSTSEGREILSSTDSKVLLTQLKVLQAAIPFAKDNLSVLVVEAPMLLRYDERAIGKAIRNIVPYSISSKDGGVKVNVNLVSCETLCKKCPSAFAHCLRLTLLDVPFRKWELSLREWISSGGDDWAHCFTARPIVCSEWGYKIQIQNFERKNLEAWTRKDRDSNRVYSVGGRKVKLTSDQNEDDDD
jgi:hypothetical protein